MKLDTISTEDVEAVLLSTKPSARQFKNKYESWRKEYESVYELFLFIFLLCKKKNKSFLKITLFPCLIHFKNLFLKT